jgi:RNA polymerase subunit RPABC4/transcription elongation factor Spt4
MSEMINCKACGKEIAKSAKACPHCGKKNKKPLWQKLIIVAVVLAIVIIASRFMDGTGNFKYPDKAPTTPAMSKEEYIVLCQTYSYADIARNPEEYKGKPAVFTGKVIQVLENGKKVTLRVNVTKGNSQFWSDTIYIDYTRSDERESRILDDDVITIYGDFNGIKSYKTALGGTMSIPWVLARYIGN